MGGRTRTSGQGRPKGVPNKATKALKDMILGALEDAGGKEGGQGYLKAQAAANPSAFMALVGRVLPQEVKAQIETTVVVVERSYGK